MNKLKTLLMLLFASAFQIVSAQNAHQNITIDANVSTSIISVTNNYQLPEGFMGNNKFAFFYLNKNLTISEVKGGKAEKVSNNNEDISSYVNKYKLTLKKSAKNNFTITYAGVINDAIEESAAEYARGFSETTGMITENGAYMAGSTYWLPKFNDELLSSFKLDITIDKGWSVVSQGQRTLNEEQGDKMHIIYDSPEPMDEVYFTGATWTEYSKQLGDVEVQVFLRTADEELAQRYLDITSGYVQMYETLIGEYPYTKFSLVENFWETGYGMPSFTLLGEKVIRFPWILYSSYPHELLHNYWGNSVFVNYSGGNWCEGITAYMADHLLQEQRGNGATYRRNTLQKFTDFVNEDNDFPINQFLSRNNSAEEAIGYGKVLMVNNMLRSEFGDETFIKAYQKFYKDYKFQKVSFPEIQKSFEAVTGEDLSAFFAQWIDRKGAPAIGVSGISSEGNTLTFTLKQTQAEDVFNVKVPIAIFTKDNNEVVWKNVIMTKKEQQYSFELAQKPLRLEIDPQFNVMRRLDRKEVPSSLSQVFGETNSTIIIPAASTMIDAYQKMAETWKATQEAQGKAAVIVKDADLEAIPQDQSVWIFGYDNKFYNNELQTLYNDHFDSAKLSMINNLEASGALVFAMPNTQNVSQSVGFVGASSTKAVAALTRKLPHYGKYGYLGFEADEANNVMKGSLPALESPLIIKVNDGEVTSKIAPRKALFQPAKRAGRPTH